MVVIARKSGRLGNRLFVFAHFVAFAIEHQIRISNPSFDEYANFFRHTKDDLFCRYPAERSFLRAGLLRKLIYCWYYGLARLLDTVRPKSRTWEVIRLAKGEIFNLSAANFVDAARGKCVLARGWLFRDEDSLVRHGNAIRDIFRPIESIEKAVDALITNARRECDILIGVHIRQGDYKAYKKGKYFHEASEYAELMKEVEQLCDERRVGFLVCSDSGQDPKAFDSLRFQFGSGHPVEDLYALAKCDFIIGPPSTYTVWASFYGRVPRYSVQNFERPITLEDFVVCQLIDDVSGA